MRSLRFAAVLLCCASAAHAGERILQFRSVEDPAVSPAPAVCAAAPFRVNVRLAASLWATRARASDGRLVEDDVRRIGTATACVRLTNFAFPAGLQQEFYVRFDLPEGSYTALGTCTLISNDVPKGGVVLAGCALRLVDYPSGVRGGMATSASVFNPFRLTGFATGSLWTLHAYDDSASSRDAEAHAHHGHDAELVEDTRSDEEISKRGLAVGR